MHQNQRNIGVFEKHISLQNSRVTLLFPVIDLYVFIVPVTVISQISMSVDMMTGLENRDRTSVGYNSRIHGEMCLWLNFGLVDKIPFQA